VLVEPARQRGPVDHLYRDPEQPVDLDPEHIDVRGVWMIEPRRDLGLAHEAPHDRLAVAQPLVEDLDDRWTTERLLLAAIHRAVAAFADPLADDEVADGTSAHAVGSRHETQAILAMQMVVNARGRRVSRCVSHSGNCRPAG